MKVSIVIATCGDDAWGELAWSRAYPSAREELEPGPGGLGVREVQVIVEHYPSLSVPSARNAAAAIATGDWLCFLDADDELEPGYIAAMARAFREGAILEDWSPLLVPARRLVAPELAGGFVAGQPMSPAGIPNRGGWPAVNECVIGTLVRRERFEEVGGFRELPSIEDYDLWLRCYDAGAQLVYVEDAVYREHVSLAARRNNDQSPYPAIWQAHLDRIAAGVGRR